MNLYYQCTQNDINNYALHHYGGQMRSYPRWVTEFNVCIDHLQQSKTLFLDFYGVDDRVSLQPCDPQIHGSPVYIDYEEEVHTGVALNAGVKVDVTLV